MSDDDKKLALHWYAVKGYDLQTIADHFKVTRDELARELNTE